MANSEPVRDAHWLLTPEAIRTQCGLIYAAAERDALSHFTLYPDALEGAAELVADVTRQAYPDLEIPFHARWRHFVVDGEDLAAPLFAPLAEDPLARARAKIELAIVSVLLDAGSGPDWSYRDPRSGKTLARSEGLAIASLDLHRPGGMTADTLRSLNSAVLKDVFQVSDANPLAGMAGRAALIGALGDAVAANPTFFGSAPARLGHLADLLHAEADGNQLPARAILIAILKSLGPIWSGRAALDGVALGDCWPHPATGHLGLVPFHKLSQWLSYSLIEPLQELGLEITGIDGLTGLAEYRNGGLFLDTGVLALRDPEAAMTAWPPGSQIIVEWRALTVCLLDRIAPMVRAKLGKTEAELPLAAILEGGTWAAGRRIAAEKRAGGGPPLMIQSDGSVF